MVVAIIGGVAYSVIQAPTYKATASVEFTDSDAVLSRVGVIQSPSFTPDKVASANIGTITSPKVLRLAINQLSDEYGLNLGLRPLRDRIDAKLNTENNLVEITASAASGPVAIRMANSVAVAVATVQNELARAQFASQAEKLEDELTALQKTTKGSGVKSFSARQIELESNIGRLKGAAEIATVATVIERAGGEISPSSPQPLRDCLLAAFLGLLLGLIAALVRESLDRTLHSAAEIQNSLEIPVIGLVREIALGRAILAGDGARLDEVDIDAYRILRNNIEFLDVDRDMRSVLITSALPEEGKSTLAASLAQTSAAAGVKTLLIECDLRRPTLHDRLGINPEPGLTDYLVRQYDLADVLQVVDSGVDPEAAAAAGSPVPGLTCISAGSRSPVPAEVLGSQRFKAFFAQMIETYEFVVIDTSPLLSVVDTRELVPLADGVLLCVRASRTTRAQMIAARDAIQLYPDRPIGVVITAVKKSEEPDYGYYSSSYSYGYSSNQ